VYDATSAFVYLVLWFAYSWSVWRAGIFTLLRRQDASRVGLMQTSPLLTFYSVHAILQVLR